MAKREFTKKECLKIALRYSQKRLFIAKEMTCYQYAKAHGWVDEITAHMKRYTRVKKVNSKNSSYRNNTDEELISIALTYETIKRLHSENLSLYQTLINRHITPSSIGLKRTLSPGKKLGAVPVKEQFPYMRTVWIGEENIRFFDQRVREKSIIINDLISYYMQLRTDFTTQLLKASEGYTIQQLSDLTGVDKSNVHKMLNGKSNPSIDTILKVTNALNQDIIVKPRNNK